MKAKKQIFELINELHMNSTVELFATNFSKFNLFGLELLMDKNKLFDGISKTQYLNYFKTFFEEKKAQNIKELNCKPIVCMKCKKGCIGFVFLDEQNKQSYTFIAEDENGKITDLKECSKFETEQNLVGYKFKHVREFPVF
jgi:hypothetical protein